VDKGFTIKCEKCGAKSKIKRVEYDNSIDLEKSGKEINIKPWDYYDGGKQVIVECTQCGNTIEHIGIR